VLFAKGGSYVDSLQSLDPLAVLLEHGRSDVTRVPTIAKPFDLLAVYKKSGQLDLNRARARPLSLQFPRRLIRTGSLFARVGPTKPRSIRTDVPQGITKLSSREDWCLSFGSDGMLLFALPVTDVNPGPDAQVSVTRSSTIAVHGVEMLVAHRQTFWKVGPAAADLDVASRLPRSGVCERGI
jgi:hypothetical protein